MPTIRANRESIDDRFSVLGFTVRTESPLFEVGLATDPELFRAGAQRTRRNFYSSRVHGAMRARRGEAVYLVPPEVLANFLGQQRLYFGLVTYREGATGQPEAVLAPSAGNMYINLSGLTERGLRRVSAAGAAASTYGSSTGQDVSLQWGGDATGMSKAAPVTKANGNGSNANGNGTSGSTAARAAPAPYDDGFGAFPAPSAAPVAPNTGTPASAQGLRAAAHPFNVEDDDAMGIEGAIPDDEASLASAQGVRALTTPPPEYPQASRFEPAAPGNYRVSRGTRSIQRVVVHITDGGSRINGTIGWFKNPQAKVSAHYVIGQDGEVVQMVRHNDVAWHARSANSNSIGIEHVANTRGLNPTAAQLCASAALVSWLCDQYGIAVDRTHILGHSEADTRTTHTGCPNSVWDWDYYMELITTRTCVDPPPGSRIRGTIAQSARAMSAAKPAARPVVVRAQEIITPFYDPADPNSALTCQNDAFSQAREEWFVGVPSTLAFPHSAICQLKMTASDGSRYQGTGFYIGRNRILTCAHNLSGMASCTIIPGRNGGGSDNTAQPFGQVTVNAAAWRVAPGYTGDGNYPNDLAVIDNVPLAAPNGKYFKFLNATPSDRLPIVVCGYSAASDAVPALTAAIDRDKQHLHGGYATQQSDPETIDYAILTLKGASGSPVYHIDESTGQLAALITAVHVSGAPAARGANRGCFITPAKIDWIEGRTTSFATRALAMESFSTHWDTTPHYPQSSPMSCWAAAAAMIVGWRDQRRIADTEIAAKVPVFEAYKNGLFPDERRALADAWNLVPEAAASYTIDSWHDMLRTYGPLYIDMTWDTSGGGHARVLVGMTSDGAPDGSDTVMYLHDPWPDSPGRIKLSFADFLALYEGRTDNSGGHLQYQILHAATLPAQLRPTLAAPFSLATADPSGRSMLPHRSSEGTAPRLALAQPPEPIVQQLQRARALTIPAAVEIASVVAGATMERIANNAGDITWELDQLRGFKHPNDAAPTPLPAAQDGPVIRISDWPRVSDSHIDDIFAGFEINWQHNGKSVGNVMISNIATNDAVGWGLTVKAKIMDDNIVYPRDNPSFAALRVRFEYRFTHVLVRDQIAIVDVHLFGNGKYNLQGRWEQTGMM